MHDDVENELEPSQDRMVPALELPGHDQTDPLCPAPRSRRTTSGRRPEDQAHQVLGEPLTPQHLRVVLPAPRAHPATLSGARTCLRVAAGPGVLGLGREDVVQLDLVALERQPAPAMYRPHTFAVPMPTSSTQASQFSWRLRHQPASV